MANDSDLGLTEIKKKRAELEKLQSQREDFEVSQTTEVSAAAIQAENERLDAELAYERQLAENRKASNKKSTAKTTTDADARKDK